MFFIKKKNINYLPSKHTLKTKVIVSLELKFQLYGYVCNSKKNHIILIRRNIQFGYFFN
jgi:hypothetical protein